MSKEKTTKMIVELLQQKPKFIEYIKQNNKELEKILKSISKDSITKFWEKIQDSIKEILDQKLYTKMENEKDLSEEEKQLILEDFQFLSSITTLCDSFREVTLPSYLLVVTELHDHLFEFGVCPQGTNLQEQVSTLCEKIYLANSSNESTHILLPQTVSYLLAKSIDKSAKKADVKRVWGIRDAFKLLDENSTIIQDLLSRCTISPLYLGSEFGEKFIVFIFTLSPILTELVHMAIIPQIHTSSSAILEIIGEIYYKAWKGSSGQVLLKIEYNCIQDLMYHAIHCRDNALFQNIRKILNSFHTKKKVNGVDEMLLRLYEPILFRSLNAANSTVRKNASSILIDAFPLINTENQKEEVENGIEKQYEILKTMLFDEVPLIRCVAVEGICKILCVFWEMIPNELSFEFLKTIIYELAYDSSSANVRCSVFKGLSFLLDNHLSHPILKELLKSLSCFINDSSKIVRSDFIDFLLKVKSVRNIKYFDIVAVDDLLLRLAVDVDQVSDKITKLIVNSYFPFDKPPSTQMERFIDYVERSFLSAKRFYVSAIKIVPSPNVSKMIHIINKYLKKLMEIEGSNYDVPLIEKILEIQYLMFTKLLKVVNDKKLIKSTKEIFKGDYLFELQEKLKSQKVSSFIWGISKHLEDVDDLKSKSIEHLEKMFEDEKLRDDYKFIIQCCQEWKKDKKLKQLIEKYLSKTFSKEVKKKKTTKEFEPIKGSIALEMYDSFKKYDETIFNLISNYHNEIPKYLEKGEINLELESFYLKVFHLYPKILIRENKGVYELMKFYSEKVLNGLYKYLSQEKKKGKKRKDEKESVNVDDSFGLQITKTMIIYSCECIQLGLIRNDFKFADFIYGILQKQFKPLLKEVYFNLMKLFYSMIKYSFQGTNHLIFDFILFLEENEIIQEYKYLSFIFTEEMVKELVDKCLKEYESNDDFSTPFLKFSKKLNAKLKKIFISELSSEKDEAIIKYLK